MSTTITLTETNVAPENGWLRTVSFRDCKTHVGVVIHNEFTPISLDQSNLHQAFKGFAHKSGDRNSFIFLQHLTPNPCALFAQFLDLGSNDMRSWKVPFIGALSCGVG